MKSAHSLVMLLALAPAPLFAIDLDASFGTGGRVVLEDADRYAADAILQSDGKIVVVGSGFVARFNANGTLDTSFDGDGLAAIDFGGLDVAQQSDGRLVIVGSTGTTGVITRLNSNGSLDTSFHGTGVALLSGFSDLSGIAIQTDAKVLVGGRSSQGPTFSVARVLANGSLDATYATNGVATFPPPSGPQYYERLNALALQADGKLVGVGFQSATVMADLSTWFAAVRLDTSGAPDPTFGTGGRVPVPEQDSKWLGSASGVRMLPDGSVLVAGTQTWVWQTEGPPHAEYQKYGAVVRLGSAGTVDSGFGTNGWARHVNARSYGDIANGLALDASGNILVPGASHRTLDGWSFDMAVSRLTPNGAMDLNFGDEGRVVVDFTSASTAYSATATELLVQPDGGLVLVGTRSTGGATPSDRLVLARLCGPTVHFSSSSTSLSESTTSVTLTVRRSCGAAAGPVSVSYATNAGTASAGSDFTAANGTLTWAPSDADEKTVTIQLPGDASDEPDEQFTVALSGANGAERGAWFTHTVTITDDDNAAVPPPSATPARGGGGALGSITLLSLLTIGLLAALTGRRRPLARAPRTARIHTQH